MNQHCDYCGRFDYVLYKYRGVELCPECYEIIKKQDDEILGRDDDDGSL